MQWHFGNPALKVLCRTGGRISKPFIGGPNMRWPCGNPATDLAALNNLIGIHLSEDFEEYPAYRSSGGTAKE